MLTLIPDSGRSYMSKFYDDNWMLEHGFLERQAPLPTVEEVLHAKHGGAPPDLVTISAHQKVGEGIDTMQRYGISQLPVVRDGECESLADVIGSLQDRALLERVFTNPDVLHEDVATAMQPPLAAVEASAAFDDVFATLTGGTNAVLVAREGKPDRRADALATCSSSSRTGARQPETVSADQVFNLVRGLRSTPAEGADVYTEPGAERSPAASRGDWGTVTPHRRAGDARPACPAGVSEAAEAPTRR